MYDFLAQLQIQNKKKIILCKIPAHTENEKAGKQQKKSIECKTRLSYIDYYLTIRRARNSKLEKEWENSAIKLQRGKVPTKVVGNMRLGLVGFEVKTLKNRIFC